VEFGPAGAGHHGPDEWVSISSLSRYRQALTDFVRQLPAKLADGAQATPLRAVEGGRS
jgi:succinyl-diaminopimelate desuccinylase